MPLAAGTRLGPYEVLGLIGSGGMGEVYKARDTRLDRTVAIKVLPAELSSDPERRTRFEREARAIASLAHPHICTLHDVGAHDGTTYLVMEHLAGETLADRLLRGPVPLAQALELAVQIADALDFAHKLGVVHRDLKPGNVMLTSGGARRSGVTSAKMLDFGLAKLAGHGERPALAGSATGPTMSAPVTAEGTILGTLQYMAPEQLEGKEADARTDLWALGGILYEMVTGRRAFAGDTQVSLIGNIMNAEPAALATLQPLTPPALERLVRRCLAKSPDDRPDTAHDIADDLRWVREMAATPAARLAYSPRRLGLGQALSVAAALLLLMAGWGWLRPPVLTPTPLHLTIPLETPVASSVFGTIAISPNGQTLVFKQGGYLVRRPLDSFSTTVIEGPRDPLFVAFSPGGRSLAFTAGGRLQRVPLAGGSVEDLGAPGMVGAMGPVGIDWGEDDRIYCGLAYGTGGIWRVPAAGGAAEPVTQLDVQAGETAHNWPQLLPGRKVLLYTVLGSSGGSDDSRVVVQAVGSPGRTTVADRATFGRWVESGHLIFIRNDGNIYAVPFNPQTLAPRGRPVPVVPAVGVGNWGGQAFLAVSRNGTLAFAPRTHRPEMVFRLADAKGRAGRRSAALDPAALAKVGSSIDALTLSPDGTRFAATTRSPGACDVWLLDAATGEAERVTFDPAEDELPVWSPDSKAIAFTSAEPGGMKRRISIKASEGGRQPRVVITWPSHVNLTSWSPDGRWLALFDSHPSTGSDVWAISVDGRDKVQVAMAPGDQSQARFSPDGNWIAYASTETGRSEVYVASFPGLDSRHQVSADGGTSPDWAPDGRILYYLQRGHLVAQDVRLGKAFTKGLATTVFDTVATAFQVVPGGGFLLTEPNDQPPDAPLLLIVNWFEELKAKAPSGQAK